MLPLFTPPTTPMTSSSSQGISQLSEFASSMVYLMWHSRKTTTTTTTNKSTWSPSLVGNDLAYLMWQSRKPTNDNNYYSPLGGGCMTMDQQHSFLPSPAFKKFCFQVLTATQLQESAVYLSLKYIAILLQSNPSIEGAEGSEYRLFIVALMLANKFLDDNTFTNKTWSDVSGMKVLDLNIMESEFLEALDYNLFVRQHEYQIWKQLLEECRDRAQMSFYDSNNPQQRHQLVLMTLQTLGLYNGGNYCWERLQLENSQKRYQHFLQQKTHQPPYMMQLQPQQQPPASWNYNYGYQHPITNLSQSSWDPLAYSLNRCQDTSFAAYSTARPISWRNFN